MTPNFEEKLKKVRENFNSAMIKKPNWLSVKKKDKCFYSRRNGYVGKIIFGYSVRLRLFGIEII